MHNFSGYVDWSGFKINMERVCQEDGREVLVFCLSGRRDQDIQFYSKRINSILLSTYNIRVFLHIFTLMKYIPLPLN